MWSLSEAGTIAANTWINEVGSTRANTWTDASSKLCFLFQLKFFGETYKESANVNELLWLILLKTAWKEQSMLRTLHDRTEHAQDTIEQSMLRTLQDRIELAQKLSCPSLSFSFLSCFLRQVFPCGPRLTSNLLSFCLSFPRARDINVYRYYHIFLFLNKISNWGPPNLSIILSLWICDL